jgi:hypothetical protein
MNSFNSAMTSLFDAVLTPLEWLGPATALIVVSGVFGVLALIAFKHISWQAGIKAAKDRIKGHMIEIRIYQDDLLVVASAVAKVVLQNFKYLGLNFGPILPLAIPFAFVSAQFVVRYAYDPLPVTASDAKLLAGQGTLLEIELRPGREKEVRDLKVTLPPGLKAVSPLVRVPSQGQAFQEFVAVAPGRHEIALDIGGEHETKIVFAGGAEAPRWMQPRRVSNGNWFKLTDPDHWPVLWPAEAGLPSNSALGAIAITYPLHPLPWWPDGELGILLGIVVASMVIGAFALKPLGVQI